MPPVLLGTQKLLRFTGLKFDDAEPLWYRVYRMLCVLTLASMLQPQISYFIVNLADLVKATDVLVQISAEIMSTIKVIWFLCNWRTAKALLQRMQTKFDESTLANFGRANAEGLWITGLNNVLLISAGIFHTGGPVVILVYHQFRGTMRPELWVHPFKGVFVFDYESMVGYVVGYAINIMYNVSVASYFGAMDTFYVGLCLFGCAHLEDARSLMQLVKNELPVGRKIKGVIECHQEALDFLANVQRMLSGLILVQFIGVVCVLSTLAFQIIIISDGRILMYIVPCAAMVMELFLYCYYGNKLTTKSFELLDSVYQSTWYEYPIRYQRYVQLMMVRMQRPMVLTGYDVVLCNLPTFTTVLRTVASVIAVFQSME